ncbi:hypothetical protein FBUS_10675, partial [Fasciolopsis buskii]
EPPLVDPYGNRIGCETRSSGAQVCARSTTGLNLMPLQVTLNRVVLTPLFAYILEVDRAICDHFLYELHLMDHFHCLRQFYFLEHSEFAQSLLDELFTKVNIPFA